jgi:hypothetical protein
MATDLTKPVRRRSSSLKRDAGKLRKIIVSMYPAGFIGLRLEKCRREETFDIAALYDLAVRSRVLRERQEKKKAKQR